MGRSARGRQSRGRRVARRPPRPPSEVRRSLSPRAVGLRSSFATTIVWMSGTSACTGIRYSADVRVDDRPVSASTWVSSNSAMPSAVDDAADQLAVRGLGVHHAAARRMRRPTERRATCRGPDRSVPPRIVHRMRAWHSGRVPHPLWRCCRRRRLRPIAPEQFSDGRAAVGPGDDTVLQPQRIGGRVLPAQPWVASSEFEQLVAHRLASREHRGTDACDRHRAARHRGVREALSPSSN